MTGDRAIHQTLGQGVSTAAVGVDHEGQGDLVQPGGQFLTGEFLWRIISDRQGVFEVTLPKGARTCVEEEPRIEIKVAPPVFIRLAQVE